MSEFSRAEREAMRQRAVELKAQKGGNKLAKNLQALIEAIEALPDGDRELAVALHQVMTDVAPELAGRTWYGMPAYERDGEVIVFLQVTSKFDTRYSTLGFNQGAHLEDGEIWPTHFAIPQLTPRVKEQMRELIAQALTR